jgi:nucleoside-diphosphate-sugar epimerase
MNNTYNDKAILVTGGAGFIGSHLTDYLLNQGAFVTVVDNFITGNKENLASALENPRFRFIEADASQPPSTYLQTDSNHTEHFDYIFHFASPASPRGYMDKPIETYEVNSFGSHFLAQFALETGATILFASTSEAYGDPLEHPQKESYWGNVNPVGVRSCYDESKRFGEMVFSTWAREKNLDMRIVRIFNTYGPRMDPRDGRVIPNFVTQALKGDPITVHGDGTQTRSFCYVDDLVQFIVRMAASSESRGEVINIGNPDEYTMLDFAQKVKDLTGSNSEIVFVDRPSDDPNKRKPDISKAKAVLSYEPQMSLDEGLGKTIEFFRNLNDERRAMGEE